MARARKNRPWFWDTYLADAALAMCSLSAQGLWARILGYCDRSEVFGHLLVGGKRVDVGMLATLVNKPLEEVQAALDELEMHRVFSRTRGGVLYNRKMVRDARNEEVWAANGRKGGNPNLSRARENSEADNPLGSGVGLESGVNPTSQPASLIEKKERKNLPPAPVLETANLGGGFLKGGNGQHHPDYERIIGPIEGLINSPRPLVFGIVQEWLEAGTTPGEIIDTINAVLRRQRADDPSWQPGSLKYFGPAIERTRIARIAGRAPATGGRPVRSVHEGGPRTQRMWSHAERAKWMKDHGFELMFSAHPDVQAKLREEGVLEHWPTAREV